MDQSRFETLADETLGRFMDAIDADLGDMLDVDLENGILKIELDDGGQYVINKHGPNRQIWLSSPLSGASHFDFDEASEGWVGTRGQGDLAKMLAGELATATGGTLDLS